MGLLSERVMGDRVRLLKGDMGSATGELGVRGARNRAEEEEEEEAKEGVEAAKRT
jgi:hypothetical protein